MTCSSSEDWETAYVEELELVEASWGQKQQHHRKPFPPQFPFHCMVYVSQILSYTRVCSISTVIASKLAQKSYFIEEKLTRRNREAGI